MIGKGFPQVVEVISLTRLVLEVSKKNRILQTQPPIRMIPIVKKPQNPWIYNFGDVQTC